MAILGVTNDERGMSMQRLPVTTKVSIGMPPRAGENYPKKLDHFQFLEKAMVDGENVWTPDKEVTDAMVRAYGSNPTSIGIVFVDDDPESVFKTEFAWWSATEWKCHGNLVQIEDGKFAMQAVRRTQRCPDGEPWPGTYRYGDNAGALKGQPVKPCGDGCLDLEDGHCKPSGDLHFILEKFPRLGGICRLHTTSWRSIRNLSNGLQQIRSFLGGRLSGIRCVLELTPEKIVYQSDKGKKSSTGYILSVSLGADNFRNMIDKATEFAKLAEDTRKMLGNGPIVIDDPEDERARELTAEFYPALPAPDDGEPVAEVPKANIPATSSHGIRQPGRVAQPTPAPQSQTVAVAQPATAPKANVTNGANGKNNGPAMITDDQRKAIMRAAAENGWSNQEVGKLIKNKFGFPNMKEVTADKFDAIYQRVTNPSAFFEEDQSNA